MIDNITYEEMNKYRVIKFFTLFFLLAILLLCITFLIFPPVQAISIKEIKQICTLNDMYPIGSIYTTVSNKNPKELLGFGTWVRVGEGEYMIGQNETPTYLSTALNQFGVKYV